MSIAAIVGGAISTMLLSVAGAQSNQMEVRGQLVSHASAAGRVAAAVRSAKMVLAKGDSYLVLWAPTSSSGHSPRLSELRRIDRKGTTKRLRFFQAPDDLAEADDVTYDLATTDFSAVTAALRGSDCFPRQIWAEGMTGFTTALDDPDPRQARFVCYRMTVSVNGVSETTVGGAGLRNR